VIITVRRSAALYRMDSFLFIVLLLKIKADGN
jgi:hypothetical protein